jgi:signal transduction histidine kinase
MDARANRFLENFSDPGRERLLGHLVYEELAAGEYLFHEGEIAVLDRNGRSTDALARSPVSLARVPAAELFKVLETEPVAVTLDLFKTVLARLRVTNQLYVQEVVHNEKLSLIGEMAGSLMHDLRNPVQVILSAAEMIQLTHSDPATADRCEKVRLQCDRLGTMAGELLEFSKGESTLHLGRTDTKELLEQFKVFNQDFLESAGVHFHFEADAAEVEIDSMRLQRVLQNLVTNSVEALGSQKGGRVEVRASVSDSILHLAVGDNGPGLPEEIRARVFEPFVTHGKKGGTGLGMAIVRNIIVGHRGVISFETAAGKGTRFLAKIPQDAASPAVAESKLPPSDPPA